jgi:hypothetical protein
MIAYDQEHNQGIQHFQKSHTRSYLDHCCSPETRKKKLPVASNLSQVRPIDVIRAKTEVKYHHEKKPHTSQYNKTTLLQTSPTMMKFLMEAKEQM